MGDRNPDSPWNPASSPNISPKEYEQQVVEWLHGSGSVLEDFKVQHLKHLEGPSGDYEFDAVASFTILSGAKVVVVVECKRYSKPVERDHMLTLWAKKEDVNAHKAMMFATCGIHSGALKYASAKGVATVTFVQCDFLYETKAVGVSSEPPPWAEMPQYAGIMLRCEDNSIQCSTINKKHLDALKEWLKS